MTPTALTRVSFRDQDGCILVHATSTSSTQLLDLTLKATEGERAYETKLKESEIGLCKHKQFTGSDEELRSIFLHLFLKTPIADSKLVEGLELSAHAEEGFLTIRIGRRFGKVKQQIATVGIPEQEETEIPIFDWAAELCAVLDSANENIQKHHSGDQDKDKLIESLTKQLETLTALKKDHEEQLLVKFKELLNAKKIKIRELGRELESASAAQEDEAGTSETGKGKGKATSASPKLEPESELASAKSRRKATPKAAPKAKAPPKAATASRKRKPLPPPSDSEDEFAEMDVDEPPNRATRTTRADSKVPKKVAAKTPPPPVEDDDAPTESEEPQSDRQDSEDEDELPPVRKPIEFRPAPQPAPQLMELVDNGDETDDEL